jgi:hypothetical protein
MAGTLAAIRRNQLNAQQYRADATRELTNRSGAAFNPYALRSPHAIDPLGMGTPGFMRGKGLSVAFGTTPTTADVDKFVAMTGGNPYTQQMQAARGMPGSLGQRGAAGAMVGQAGGNGQPTEPDLFQQTMQSVLADNQRAREENLKRYDEVKGMYGDLGQRNQERIGNWGLAQAELNAERASESLGNQQAYLASRGLANSTILPAFMQRNARDLALQQQALSEARDNRMLQSDTSDTERLGSFIERRNDVGPDTGQLLQMALEYGRSGDGEGMAALQQEIDSLRNGMGQGGYSPLYNVPGPRGGVQFVDLFGGQTPVGNYLGGMQQRAPQQVAYSEDLPQGGPTNFNEPGVVAARNERNAAIQRSDDNRRDVFRRQQQEKRRRKEAEALARSQANVQQRRQQEAEAERQRLQQEIEAAGQRRRTNDSRLRSEINAMRGRYGREYVY